MFIAHAFSAFLYNFNNSCSYDRKTCKKLIRKNYTFNDMCTQLELILLRPSCEMIPHYGGILSAHYNNRASSSLQWRHNGRGGVSNHQLHDCLLKRLFRRRSKQTSKLRVTGLCVGNSPVTGQFTAQRASNTENVSIWWRYHANRALESAKSWWFKKSEYFQWYTEYRIWISSFLDHKAMENGSLTPLYLIK